MSKMNNHVLARDSGLNIIAIHKASVLEEMRSYAHSTMFYTLPEVSTNLDDI